MEGVSPDAGIGHIHLKVSDLERSLAFYSEAIAMDIVARWGTSAAFLSFGGYHHHLGLNTWESKGGSPPPRGTTGLYHFAIRYPSRRDLGLALKRLLDHGVELDGAADHGPSLALYLHDPDGNGVELMCDRDRSEWPRDAQGNVVMFTEPLDLQALLAEAEQ